jgi:hypothetical protein
MKRILLFIIGMSFLFSCEYQNDSLTTINKDITSQYLLNGNLNVYLSNNQVFRYKGKPGIEIVSIGNTNLSKYENCFILHVETGTTPATTVSSAIIKLDGLEVLNTSDFSKNSGQNTFEICNLTPTSALSVEVRGEPGSYIDIWIEGKLKDEVLFRKGLDPWGNMDLYKMNPDGSDVGFIHTAGSWNIGDAIWSKDKNKILYTSDESSTGKIELFLMNSDGSNNIQITNDAPQYGNNFATFRSDSKIWYSNSQSTGWGELFEINYDGTNKYQLTNFYSGWKSADYGVDINKENTKLCYYKQNSSDGYSGRIYISNIDFSNEQRLSNVDAWECYPQFSPNGQQIAYVKGVGQNLLNIFVINIDGSGDTKLTGITTYGKNAYKPIWSSDGNKIAYSVFDGSQWDIWVINSDGTNNMNLTNTSDLSEIVTDWK